MKFSVARNAQKAGWTSKSRIFCCQNESCDSMLEGDVDCAENHDSEIEVGNAWLISRDAAKLKVGIDGTAGTG